MTGGPVIEAQDATVADLIAEMLQLIRDAGGWINPDTRLVEDSGELSVHCTAADGEPLMSIPRTIMVRVSSVDWAVRDSSLEIVGMPDDMAGVERESAILMTELHNRCGKPGNLAASHPSLAADLDPSMVVAIRSLRPRFRQMENDVADVLWATRRFREPDGPGSVCAPVVDFLNHSTAGAPITWTKDSLSVEVRSSGGQSWLNYGSWRDPIEMALAYGFADASATVAHSAPVIIKVPRVGRVAVAPGPRDISGNLRPVTAHEGNGLTVLSRVSFGPDRRPIHDVSRATGWSIRDSQAVVDAIATKNQDCLEAVGRAASGMTPGRVGLLMAEACELQARLIRVETT